MQKQVEASGETAKGLCWQYPDPVWGDVVLPRCPQACFLSVIAPLTWMVISVLLVLPQLLYLSKSFCRYSVIFPSFLTTWPTLNSSWTLSKKRPRLAWECTAERRNMSASVNPVTAAGRWEGSPCLSVLSSGVCSPALVWASPAETLQSFTALPLCMRKAGRGGV